MGDKRTQTWRLDPKAKLLVGSFANRVSTIRRGKGWTMRDAESHSGIGSGHISLLENGQSLPTILTIQRLAAAYGVDPGWLAFGEG